MFLGGAEEFHKEGVGSGGAGFVLGVKLAGHEEGVAGKLDGFHPAAVFGKAGKGEAPFGQLFPVVVVDLVAVPVPFVDDLLAVYFMEPGAGFQFDGVKAQAQGAPIASILPFFREEVDNGVGGVGVEFGAVGLAEAADMAGKFHHGQLHAQADAEEGNVILPGIADGLDFSFYPLLPVPAGNEDPLDPGQVVFYPALFQVFGVYPPDINACAGGNAGMDEGLGNAEIGIVEGHIFPHQGDGGFGPAIFLGPLDQIFPLGKLPLPRRKLQVTHGDLVQPLLGHEEGKLVEDVGIEVLDDGVLIHITKEGDLVLDFPGEGVTGAADDDIGLDTDGAELLDAVLGGFGLQLPGGLYVGDQGDMDIEDIIPADVDLHLADGLQEGKALDVADGAPDLNYSHVGIVIFGNFTDTGLDLVGDVGNDLDGAPRILPPALLLDDGPVDLAGGDVAAFFQVLVDEALVVAHIQVAFGPVVGDEDLAVLEGAHGAGVDVYVGIEFLHGDFKAPALEETAQGSGRDALPQGGDDTAGDKDEFGHGNPPLFNWQLTVDN